MYALEVKAVQFFEMSEPLIQQHSITSLKSGTLNWWLLWFRSGLHNSEIC